MVVILEHDLVKLNPLQPMSNITIIPGDNCNIEELFAFVINKFPNVSSVEVKGIFTCTKSGLLYLSGDQWPSIVNVIMWCNLIQKPCNCEDDHLPHICTNLIHVCAYEKTISKFMVENNYGVYYTVLESNIDFTTIITVDERMFLRYYSPTDESGDVLPFLNKDIYKEKSLMVSSLWKRHVYNRIGLFILLQNKTFARIPIELLKLIYKF